MTILLPACESMHVRMDTPARGDASDKAAVAIKVDPDRPFHGAGVQVPGVTVREADGGEVDVLPRRDHILLGGGIRPLPTGGFMGASGGSGKQVPVAARREKDEADENDSLAHIRLFRRR